MSESNKNLKKNAFAGFAWKLAERLGSQGVSFIVSIVLARLLLPEDYAVVSVITIFFASFDVSNKELTKINSVSLAFLPFT